MPSLRARARGCLLGLAVGDAVGTTVEFQPRGSFPPLHDMVGGGPFGLAPGQWTDDTSMALCLGASLLEIGGFDAHDQMRRYCRWRDDGYMSSTGRCFDIGLTVRAALRRFEATGDPFAGSPEPSAAGNGSAMRLAPVPLFYHPDADAAVRFAAESSRTTHGTAECIEACRLLAAVIGRALDGQDKAGVLRDGGDYGAAPKVARLARGEYAGADISTIRGTGYVVASLEAALWAFERTASFEGAVLTAANLGDDADTTAAICGQIAGAFYGADAIPVQWRRPLAMHDQIVAMADALIDARPAA